MNEEKIEKLEKKIQKHAIKIDNNAEKYNKTLVHWKF